MSPALQDFFASCESRPISRECQKQLGQLVHQCPPAEAEQFLLAYHPTKLHLQLLRAQAATKLGSLALLLDGVRSESKEVSKFYAKHPSLCSSKNSEIYDPKVLLPLLQTVSYVTRNKILSTLGRHMTHDNDEIADRLFESVVDVWGPKCARPLLCRTSENVIRKELEKGLSLSSIQILTIARRFPKLSMMLLEKVPVNGLSLKGARVLVRNNLPESLKYCLLYGDVHELLSKTTMRRVLRNHPEIVVASPCDWASILDIECVKKVLRPETLELFVLKQVEGELKKSMNLSVSSYYPPSYIKHLPPKAVSSVMNKVNWASIEDFWENNESLLAFLDADDRNRIASEIFAKTKDLDWVSNMTCDKSIPLIKENLSSEANASIRSRLVEMLLTTAKVNKDNDAFEDVCEFVAVRYRNDRDVLNTFFAYLPDMESAGEKTWTLVYSLGVRLFDPSGSNYVYSLGKLFSAALKRNGKSGLKTYIDRFFKQRLLTVADDDFSNLEAGLREECISLIFTSDNVACDDPERIRCIETLLPAISKWNRSSVQPIKAENVNTFVLNHLGSQCAVDFVLNKCNGFTIHTVEKCFEETSNPAFLQFIVKRSPERLNVSKAAVAKMANDLIDQGCFKWIKLVKLLMKKGYLEVLKELCDTSLASIRDPDQQCRRHAIILLSLTAADNSEYLQETSKLLAEMEVDQELEAPFLAQPEPIDSQDQENILKQSLQKESIYKGIGSSFSFVDTPSIIVDMLLKFCINGDMMIFVRHSVCSVSFSLPNAVAKDLLSRLVHKPVSVMKHALRIHQLISDAKTQRAFLVERIQMETHLTVRTCLFEYALSSLDNTGNVDIWEAVKEMLLRLTSKDKALVTLLHEKSVPLRFWEQYVKLLLKKIEALEEEDIDLISSFLGKISNSIDSMPISSECHENLIKSNFLSDRYFLDPNSHASVSNLFVAYLSQKADGQGSPESVIERKRLFLSEALTCAASRTSVLAYDAKLGRHPTKALLDQFVELVCSTCHQQAQKGVDENKNYLVIFIDTLLSFFARLDDTLLFGSVVRLSLASIMWRQVKVDAESAGYLVGQFIDSVFAKNAGLAHYALPVFVEKFFVYSKLDASFLQDLVFPSKPQSPEALLIRQVVATKILPKNWKKNKSLESFREEYLALVRNTPSEAIIFDGES